MRMQTSSSALHARLSCLGNTFKQSEVQQHLTNQSLRECYMWEAGRVRGRGAGGGGDGGGGQEGRRGNEGWLLFAIQKSS